MMFLLRDSYLCPGDKRGAHITDNPKMCSCGNTNLWSLAKILDQPKPLPYTCRPEYDEMCEEHIKMTHQIRIVEATEWDHLSDDMICELEGTCSTN